MTITNGTIEFSAKVSLTFTVPEGVDQRAIAEYVGNLAVERALTMVGEKPAELTKREAVLNNPTAPTSAMNAAWAGPSVGKKVANPTAPVAVDAIPSSAGGAADIMGNGVVVNPTVVEPVPSPIIAPKLEPSSATVVSPSEPVITDAQMVEAISSKNAHMLNAAADDLARQTVPVALHKLVAEFVPPPAKVQAIPAARRSEFLQKLVAL